MLFDKKIHVDDARLAIEMGQSETSGLAFTCNIEGQELVVKPLCIGLPKVVERVQIRNRTVSVKEFTRALEKLRVWYLQQIQQRGWQ